MVDRLQIYNRSYGRHGPVQCMVQTQINRKPLRRDGAPGPASLAVSTRREELQPSACMRQAVRPSGRRQKFRWRLWLRSCSPPACDRSAEVESRIRPSPPLERSAASARAAKSPHYPPVARPFTSPAVCPISVLPTPSSLSLPRCPRRPRRYVPSIAAEAVGAQRRWCGWSRSSIM